MKEKIKKFNEERDAEDGMKIMKKIATIVNEVGANFLNLNGGSLSEAQSKLAGYKFYLADYVGDINRIYEVLKLQIKEVRTTEWDKVTEDIKARDGKVKNKEQIENVINSLTIDLQLEQMLYETLYFKLKLKISSIDSILTAIAQRLAELKRQAEYETK